MNSLEKSYGVKKDYGHGPIAWLNDIEIGKATYLLSFPLIIWSLFLVGQPVFTYAIPQLGEFHLSLGEIDSLKWMKIIVYILGVTSILSLMIPMIKFFEWKYRWFLPAAVTAIVNCAGVFFLVSKKNEALEKTLAGYVYQLLSFDIRLTFHAKLFVAVNLLILACTAKMMLDIKNNEIKYPISKL